MTANGRAARRDRRASAAISRDDRAVTAMTAPRRQSVTCRLNREPTEVGRAREWARNALPGWGLDQHTDLVVLIVSELVTNAIRHGCGGIGISLAYTHGNLWIEVTDQGSGRPRLRHASPEDTTGRGLAVIQALTTLNGGELGCIDSTGGPGKTVYAVVPLPRARYARTGSPRN
jgi:anti-sigma regulatory factor (Ser/Thr protein kinase)